MTKRRLRKLLFIFVFLYCILCSTGFGQMLRRGTRHHDQVQSDSPPPVCPCVKPPSGSGCIAYNEKYQAATLEEVAVNFVDLTASDLSQALNLFNQKAPNSDNQNSIRCNTLECAGCVLMVADRLIRQMGQDQANKWGVIKPNYSPQQFPGAPTNTPLEQYCRRLRPGQARPSARGPSPGPQSARGKGPGPAPGPARDQSGGGQGSQANIAAAMRAEGDPAWLIINEAIKGNTVSSSSSSSSSNNNTTEVVVQTTPPSRNNTPSSKNTSRRHKRGSGDSSGKIGVSTALDCSYKKGSQLDDNSGYTGLCTLCWSLRTLSPKYFPRYINELSCDTSNGCLSGYGKCRERYRSIDVLYNSGTDAAPKWQQYSINSPVACECQVSAGSALHNFVSH